MTRMNRGRNNSFSFSTNLKGREVNDQRPWSSPGAHGLWKDAVLRIHAQRTQLIGLGPKGFATFFGSAYQIFWTLKMQKIVLWWMPDTLTKKKVRQDLECSNRMHDLQVRSSSYAGLNKLPNIRFARLTPTHAEPERGIPPVSTLIPLLFIRECKTRYSEPLWQEVRLGINNSSA